jgi:hypothetical protein
MKPIKRRYPLKEICENDQSQCEPKNLKKQFVFENQKVENSVDETKNMKSSLPEINNAIQLGEDDHKDMEQIFYMVMSLGVPENFKFLLEAQLKNCQSMDIRRRRWDPKVISVCLSIFLRSPQAYEDIKTSGMLLLPSKRLPQYYKNSITQTPSFNKDNILWMKKEAEKQKISDFGKHGGVLVDVMTIQDDLVIAKDGENRSLVGTVDMDPTNDNIEVICSNEVKTHLATHVLQFVFHGLTGFRLVYFKSEKWT